MRATSIINATNTTITATIIPKFNDTITAIITATTTITIKENCLYTKKS